MIHELLLALSGHPSPLLNPDAGKDLHLTDHLTPPEIALLERLAQELGGKHVKIRDGAVKIISSHPSNICRAVANSICSTHLARFQGDIIQVERNVLQQDSSMVGAYNVVSLSGIANAFDGWKEKLDWLANLVQYMECGASGLKRNQKPIPCTGKQVIERLRLSMHTGYPDTETLALHLSKVAELGWLKHASLWILSGKLPGTKRDFFVKPDDSTADSNRSYAYSIDEAMVPSFVTSSTAASILFIGKILRDIDDIAEDVGQLSLERVPSGMDFMPRHCTYLSTLAFPIKSSDLTEAISKIRLSISKNALQKLLPMPKVLELLRVLRHFFLLDRGEFAVALISSAEERLAAKETTLADQHASRGSPSLEKLMIKESEVSATLARTWTSLATYQNTDEDENDDEVELARGLLKLSIGSLESPSRKHEAAVDEAETIKLAKFDNVLLPTPTSLTLNIQHPLDLCITTSSVRFYSYIHAYLLAIRRAHHQLSKLYLLSTLRRTSFSVVLSRSPSRVQLIRSVWATVSSAIFFLAELGDFLQGFVIRESWDRFHEWLEPSASKSRSRPNSKTANDNESCSNDFRDPDAFIEAHEKYLHALTHSLLLNCEPFTKELQAFMIAIDHMSALVQRMETIIKLNSLEEKTVLSELKTTQQAVAAQLQGLVKVLRIADTARAEGMEISARTCRDDEATFVPWQSRGVDRLLLKLGHIEESL